MQERNKYHWYETEARALFRKSVGDQVWTSRDLAAAFMIGMAIGAALLGLVMIMNTPSHKHHGYFVLATYMPSHGPDISFSRSSIRSSMIS